MYNFQNKTKANFSYEIFCQRDNCLYGRVEYSNNTWEAVFWNDKGVCLGEHAQSDYDLIVEKFYQGQNIETVQTLQALQMQYFNGNDEVKEKIKKQIKDHNQKALQDCNQIKTVGAMRKNLEGVADNVPVAYQIIEDSYFQHNSGWTLSNPILPFNSKDDWGMYVFAFNSYYRKNEGIFVVEAHY